MIRYIRTNEVQGNQVEEQYDQYCAILEELLFTNSSVDEIELISLLIESWDCGHNTINEVDNITLLRFLMQEHGLRHNDLADIVAVGRTFILEILNNKRVIPPGMAVRLGRHFKLHSEIFSPNENPVKSGSSQ